MFFTFFFSVCCRARQNGGGRNVTHRSKMASVCDSSRPLILSDSVSYSRCPALRLCAVDCWNKLSYFKSHIYTCYVRSVNTFYRLIFLYLFSILFLKRRNLRWLLWEQSKTLWFYAFISLVDSFQTQPWRQFPISMRN